VLSRFVIPAKAGIQPGFRLALLLAGMTQGSYRLSVRDSQLRPIDDLTLKGLNIDGDGVNPFGVGICCFVNHGLRSGTGVPSLHPWLFKLIPSGDPAAITNTLVYF
jgi:hypothetical protein